MEDSNRISGSGATPSTGLSEYRGGKLGRTYKGAGTKLGQTRKTARLAYMPEKTATMGGEAHLMGHHLGQHLMSLHGSGFHHDFISGMESSRLKGKGTGAGTGAGRMIGAGTGAGMLEEPMPISGTNLSLSGSGMTGAYEGQGKKTKAQRDELVERVRRSHDTTGEYSNLPSQTQDVTEADKARNRGYVEQDRLEHQRQQEEINNKWKREHPALSKIPFGKINNALASAGDWVAENEAITSKIGIPKYINKGLALSKNLREGKDVISSARGAVGMGRKRKGAVALLHMMNSDDSAQKGAEALVHMKRQKSKSEHQPHPSLVAPPGTSKIGYVPSSLHYATKEGSGRGRSARAAIVKMVMAEQGLKMIEASKYVKEHGLY